MSGMVNRSQFIALRRLTLSKPEDESCKLMTTDYLFLKDKNPSTTFDYEPVVIEFGDRSAISGPFCANWFTSNLPILIDQHIILATTGIQDSLRPVAYISSMDQ